MNGRIVKIDTLDCQIKQLLKSAQECRDKSYSPYSNFKVGASVLCADGTIYPGCNIENSSFTVGLCAERCAYGRAISAGNLKFIAVAVVAYQEKSFTTPCGACRQFMSEFGDVDVYVGKPDEEDVLVIKLAELLPSQFQTDNYKFT